MMIYVIVEVRDNIPVRVRTKDNYQSAVNCALDLAETMSTDDHSDKIYTELFRKAEYKCINGSVHILEDPHGV